MRRIAWCLTAVVVALAAAAAAQADADPASDVLYTGDLFLPYSTKVSRGAEADLLAAIKTAKSRGRPIKVALIASKDDLGGVPQLFGNPRYYTRFLGAELQFVYTGRLLVVMPQGAGLAKGGRLVADKSVIAAKPGPGADGLARTAAQLVDAISSGKEAAVAAGQGTATTPRSTESSSSSSFPAGLVAGIAIALVLAVIGVSGVLLTRRKRSPDRLAREQPLCSRRDREGARRDEDDRAAGREVGVVGDRQADEHRGEPDRHRRARASRRRSARARPAAVTGSTISAAISRIPTIRIESAIVTPARPASDDVQRADGQAGDACALLVERDGDERAVEQGDQRRARRRRARRRAAARRA